MSALDNAAALYIDDSGTHDGSLVAIASAYILDARQIPLFEKDWEATKSAEGFKYFHMAEFESHRKEFSDPKWSNSRKRDRTLKRLIGIARTRSRHCVMIAVDKKAYSDIFIGDEELSKKFGKHHYTFAVMACLESVKRWRNKFAPGKRLTYVFDQMSNGKGEILGIFDPRAKKENVWGIVRDGYSFENKKATLPLQAADILAWHTYQHMCEVVLRGLPRRFAMNEISKMSFNDGWYDREGLQGIADHYKAKGIFKDI